MLRLSRQGDHIAGSDPGRSVSRHRERVVSSHWKDAAGPAPAETRIDDTIYSRQLTWYTSTGEGVVDWKRTPPISESLTGWCSPRRYSSGGTASRNQRGQTCERNCSISSLSRSAQQQ